MAALSVAQVGASSGDNSVALSEISLRSSKLRTLILTLQYPHRASYYEDWSDAFCHSPDFECKVENILGLAPKLLARLVDGYDAIIMLHSCNSDSLEFLAPLAPILGNRRSAKLLSFVGNEYNSPYVSLVEKVRLLKLARCDIVATQLLLEAGEYILSATGARIISLPHALNPNVFKPGPEHALRSLDFGIKGYRYPPYLGDIDRNRLLDYFKRRAQCFDLAIDITYDQRLSRKRWVEFLRECRGTISSEAGSWYLDRDDALIRQIYDYLVSRRKGFVIRNESLLRRAARRLPTSIKAALWIALERGPIKFEVLEDFNVSFEDLDKEFFQKAARAPVYGKAISSRHFDAIGTKTCQVMIRGRYNDILTAEEHYIGIDPSLEDAAEAVKRFKDARTRQVIVDRAYDHVMGAHTYAHRAAHVRQILEAV